MTRKETLSVYTSIRPSIKKWILIRGTLIAACGAILLLFGGIAVPEGDLTRWGWLLWLGGIVCIASGLIPYKILNRLEEDPDAIHFTSEGHFLFFKKGRFYLALTSDEIELMNFYESGTLYGIGVKLKKDAEKPHIPPYRPPYLRRPRIDIEGYDLFFPYFSERAEKKLVEEWKEYLESSQTPD